MFKPIVLMSMLAVAAVPVFAEQVLPAPHPNTRLGALRAKQPVEPFQKLFDVQRGVRAAPQPKVVCGMTVIEANPALDRKMVAPKQDGDLKYTIRAIDPAICNPSR